MANKVRKTGVHRLSIRMLIINFIITFGVVALVNMGYLVLNFFGITLISEETDFQIFLLIATIIFATFFVLVTSYLLERLVIKRIYLINDATLNIAKGDFTARIIDPGDDEIANLANSFNTMSEQLEANQYLSKNFVRDVSHEFKTPLAAVRAYAELVLAEEDINHVKEYAGIIISETDKLVDITKAILVLSSLDSEINLKMDEVNFDEMLREAFVSLDYLVKEKNLSVIRSGNIGEIRTNQTILSQAIVNLCSNAVKFSYPNKKIMIRLSSDAEHQLIFSITNFGDVIDESEQDKLFTHFYVKDPSRNTDGTGLGLPIAKKIANKLQGTLTFVSNDQDGTTFTLKVR